MQGGVFELPVTEECPGVVFVIRSCQQSEHEHFACRSTREEYSNSSEACEFMGENTLECDTLRFSGNVAPAVAKVGSLFPRFHASIWESCRQKVHRTEAGPRFALQKRKN